MGRAKRIAELRKLVGGEDLSAGQVVNVAWARGLISLDEWRELRDPPSMSVEEKWRVGEDPWYYTEGR